MKLAKDFREQITPGSIEAYAGALADISQERLKVAFREASNQFKSFPKVAELRQLARENAAGGIVAGIQACQNRENSIALGSAPAPSNPSEADARVHSWISIELTALAEAFGEQLTTERMELYARALGDIDQLRLRSAIRNALNQSTFFPKVAELRRLAGSSAEDEKKVEAEAAWRYVNEYLRKWGVNRLPIRSSGKWITAPPLEPRLEYAVRQIGGLWRLNQVTDENFPFIFRDFCEAYALAPLAELMAPQLSERFGDRKLIGNIKQLTEVKETPRQTSGQEPIKAEGPLGRDR